MKMVFVLFDSLVRNALGCYGGHHIDTPSFDRFAERSITFENHYVGSLPCMPARRDLHTGRLNFLHRSWGPLEPFDNSFSELLRSAGTYTHLITDHYHYFEDGGATFHNRYSSWDFVRGQEWDKWKAMVQPPLERFRKEYHSIQNPLKGDQDYSDGRIQSMINRDFMKEEQDYCCPRAFQSAFNFLDTNREVDNWFLHLECFDPHEPFSAPPRFKERYKTNYEGPIFDWPRYKKTEESLLLTKEMKANYAALVSMCDEYFGKLLDYFDKHDLWKDTALILSTDHGFMLEEHDWWGKNRMPFFNEIANIPLILHHPDIDENAKKRITKLTQTTDIMPTILDSFNIAAPNFVEGKSLLHLVNNNQKIRDAAMYGMFGAGTNITDGRYTYFKYPEDMTKEDLFDYTLMPMRQKSFYEKDVLSEATLINDFKFTQGIPLLKIPARRNQKGQPVGHFGQGGGYEDTTTVLYDLKTDPNQDKPFNDIAIEKDLMKLLKKLMIINEAPPEAFLRLGLNKS
jgi:arylsulfatase A-like enzyme